jgi:pilus assembly protein CpaF
VTSSSGLWPPHPPGARPADPAPPGPARNPAVNGGRVPAAAGAGLWTHLPGSGTGVPGREFTLAVAEINAVLDEVIAQIGGDDEQIRAAIAGQVRAWAQQRAAAGRPVLAAADHARLLRAVTDLRLGFGPLQPYLDDPTVEEISVNGPGTVWVTYTGGRKELGPPVAASDEELTELVRRAAARSVNPREFSTARPMLNVALRPGVRMAATLGVCDQTTVSVRKQQLMDVTLDDLVGRGTIDETLQAFLAAAVRARLDMMVTGAVAAGKTTFLRALCAEFDPAERVITLESEKELYLDLLTDRHPDTVAYEAREANQEGAGAVSLVDLMPQVLRMSPDRVLVGEVRHMEMLALLQAIDNGLEGSLTTLHANTGKQVFGRILTLCSYCPDRLDAADTFRLVGRAIDLVVHLRRDRRSGFRYVSEIVEVLEPAEKIEPATNTIFAPGADGRAVPTGYTPALIEQLEAEGFNRRLLTTGGRHLGHVNGSAVFGGPR